MRCGRRRDVPQHSTRRVTMASIDLNCDVGEGVGADDAVMPHITSANIACGVHAGDAATMQATVTLALRHGVALGAHPGFDDRANFGRRDMQLAPGELHALVTSQIDALSAVAAAHGARLAHVKPHGALYNMAATHADMATTIARAVRSVDGSLILFALSGSALARAGRDAGLVVAEEAFADRAYAGDGTLVPRTRPGAVITDANAVITHALRIVTDGVVRSVDGSDVVVSADTLCIHGDTPGAAALASALRAAFDRSGITVRAPSVVRP